MFVYMNNCYTYHGSQFFGILINLVFIYFIIAHHFFLKDQIPSLWGFYEVLHQNFLQPWWKLSLGIVQTKCKIRLTTRSAKKGGFPKI